MEPTDNLLLAALPDDERAQFIQRARTTSFDVGQVLYEQDELVTDAYFPTSGALSLLIVIEDGRAVEPAMIGREGMLGFPIGLGDDRSRWRSLVQLPGEAFVVSREELRGMLRGSGTLAPLLTHYAGLLVTFAAQSAACAQFHALEQRAARWLLLLHDRAGGDEFDITQEILAAMLGSHRPSITVALGVLRERGLIEQQRGTIRIRDRAGLEAASCECYARVELEYGERVRVSHLGAPGERGSTYPDTSPPSSEA